MERKRSYLEVANSILYVARYGARPTALVYGANLNFNIIKKYLQELEESGLITVKPYPGSRPVSRIYTTTEKGWFFMESLMKTKALYRPDIDWRSFIEIPLRVEEPVLEVPESSIAKES